MHHRIRDSLPQHVFWNLENIFCQRPSRHSAAAQISCHCGHGILHHERNRTVAHLPIEEAHVALRGLLGAGMNGDIHNQSWKLLLRVRGKRDVSGEGGDAVGRQDVEPPEGGLPVVLGDMVEDVGAAAAKLGEKAVHAPRVEVLETRAGHRLTICAVLDPTACQHVRLVGGQADVMTVDALEAAVLNPLGNDMTRQVEVRALAQGGHVEDDHGAAVHGGALRAAARHGEHFGAPLRRGVESGDQGVDPPVGNRLGESFGRLKVLTLVESEDDGSPVRVGEGGDGAPDALREITNSGLRLHEGIVAALPAYARDVGEQVVVDHDVTVPQ